MIQWFPGHMAKAKKQIDEQLKLIDIVFELIDARIPSSSQNPLMQDIIKRKPSILLMTKSSMADKEWTHKWETHFKTQRSYVLAIDSINGHNINKIITLSKEALADKFAKEQAQGRLPRSIRAMVLGIPNVGKSTLINQFVQKRVASVGDKPGITKAQQWIRIHQDLELLDTPGVLWPKFDDQRQGYHLALTGAIRDEILPKDDLVLYLLRFLQTYYPQLLHKRYQVPVDLEPLALLEHIARICGFIRQHDFDYERTYERILYDFRQMRLGKITLDRFSYDVSI